MKTQTYQTQEDSGPSMTLTEGLSLAMPKYAHLFFQNEIVKFNSSEIKKNKNQIFPQFNDTFLWKDSVLQPVFQ